MYRLFFFSAGLILLNSMAAAQAAVSTWTGATSEWTTSGNWTPTQPSSLDEADFGSTGTSNIVVNGYGLADSIVFKPGASSYAIQVNNMLRISNGGILNLSGVAQSISTAGVLSFHGSGSTGNAGLTTTAGGTTDFYDTASAGSGSISVSGVAHSEATMNFRDNSTAGTATINSGSFGLIFFYNNSTADHAVINLTAGTPFDSTVGFFDHTTAGSAIITGTNFGSDISFDGASSADTAHITGNGIVSFRSTSTAADSVIVINSVGLSAFWDSATAGTSHITINGQLVFNNYSTLANATVGVAHGANLIFQDQTTGGNSDITEASGASVRFTQNSTAGNATLHVASGATLNFENGSVGNATIISDSDVNVSGELNDTVYGGTFSGAGGLVKTGSRTLTVNSANTFTGGTTIGGGVVQTGNAGALANGDVSLLSAGTLALASGTNLQVADFDWINGGTISLALGSGSKVVSTGLFSQTGTADFIFAPSGFTGDTEYELLTFENAGATFGDWEANMLGGISGTFTVRDNGDGTSTLLVDYIGAPTVGATIDNGAPIFTPTNTDFAVEGNVIANPGAQQVGALTFANGGNLSITDSLEVNSGILDVQQGMGVVSGGILLTPGDLTKTGAGELNLQDEAFTLGNTVIQAGTLAVNGVLTTNDVLVEQGAFLKGSGLINGDVFNNGAVAPGNSPGTLTVNGNFTQSSSGTLAIEVASPQVFDRLIVTGHVALSGTLQGTGYNGYKLKVGQQFAFLQAGSISGHFDDIEMPKNYRGRFLVNGGTGSLLVAPESYTQVAENQNQRNVARALNSFIGKKGDRDDVSLALDLQTKGEYGNAFDQISPAFFQTLTDTVIEQTNAQNQFLAQRISSARLGTTGFTVSGLDQAALSVDRDGKSVMDAKSGKDIISQGTATKWGVWIQGNGIFAKVTNVSQVPNYRFNSGGFMVGADYTFGGDKVSVNSKGDGKKAVITSTTTQGSTLVLGIYGGYQGTYSKFNGGAETNINSALFGGYASYSNGGFYSDAIVGGSYNGYQVSRTINFSTIDRTGQSNPYGGTVTAYLDAGYDFHAGNFTFGPLLSGQYTYAGTAPFTENGADSLDLKVEQQNANSIRTNVGGQIAYTWNVTSSITLIPSARIFWQHEYLDGPRTIGASLDGGSGPGFDFETSDPSRDSVFAGVGLSANLGDRWNTSLYYNADFGRQDFVSHMISASLGWKF